MRGMAYFGVVERDILVFMALFLYAGRGLPLALLLMLFETARTLLQGVLVDESATTIATLCFVGLLRHSLVLLAALRCCATLCSVRHFAPFALLAYRSLVYSPAKVPFATLLSRLCQVTCTDCEEPDGGWNRDIA